MTTDKPLTQNIRPGQEPLNLKEYERAGGYQAVRKALLEMTPGEVTEVVKQSNLQGRGGAGFPTGLKWSFVPMGEGAPKTKYLIVNADEMEPGTFKDRLLLEGDPHQMVEAAIVSAYAIGAPKSYIFLRWAYRTAARRLEAAIDEAHQAGFLGKDILGSGYDLDLSLHVSAGRICAEKRPGCLTAWKANGPHRGQSPPTRK